MPKSSYQRTIIAWLLDHRFLVIAIVCIASIALLSPMRDPQVLFQESHDNAKQEDEEGSEWISIAKKFGQGELLMAVIKADDVFKPDHLRFIREKSLALTEIHRVKDVQSITTVHEIVTDASGDMVMRPLFMDIPEDQTTLQNKKNTVLSNPLWANNLLSVDTTVTVINIILPPLIRGSQDASRIIDEVRALLSEDKPEGVEVYLTGLSPMFYDLSKAAQKDFKRFFWLTWILMAALLFFAFRTIRGVLLPLGVTGLAVGWTLGLMVAMGETITSVGVMLPTLIAVVCFSDTVHVLAHYYEQAQKNINKREVLLSTMEHMMTACFLTSVTTSAAFVSLVVSKLSSIRQLGLWAAVGIMLGFFLISLLMPVILSWMPLPGSTVQNRYKHSFFTKLLGLAVRVNRRGGRQVPVITAAVVLLAVIGITNLRVETSITSFLPETTPAMQGLAIIQKNLTGFGSIEMELQGPKGCFEEPWALKEIRKIEAFLETRPDVGGVLTIADLLQWIYSKIEQSDTDMLVEPHAEGLIAESMFILTGTSRAKALAALLTEDSSTARLSARLRVAGAGEQVAVLDDLNVFIAQHLDKRLTVTITGDSARIGKQIASVLRSLTDSFGTTLLVIAVLMLWLLKSFKVAFFSMLPNVLPVLLTVGLMGGAGISLNFATVMITSIAIGVAVDNTIHFLIRYKREMRYLPDVEEAIENTIMHSGRALMFTSTVMASGCGLFVLSDFTPNQHFGFLMAFTMLTALIMDLVVLPYLIRSFRLKLP